MSAVRTIDRILDEAELLPRQPAGPLLAFSRVESIEQSRVPMGLLGDLPGLLAVFRRGITMLLEETDDPALCQELRGLDRAAERSIEALGNPSALAFLIPGLTTATLRLAERLVERQEQLPAESEVIELGQLLIEAAPTLASLLRLAASTELSSPRVPN